MTVATVITLGFGNYSVVNYVPTVGYGNYSAPTPSPSPAISDNFLPGYIDKHGRTIYGNIAIVYEKARKLPVTETLELKDAIEQFIGEQEGQALPDMTAINMAALQANERAYADFVKELAILQDKISLLEKMYADDDLLMQFALLACAIN